MTKILNFALKIKGLVGRVAHAKSSDPATPPPPPKIWNVHLFLSLPLLLFFLFCIYIPVFEKPYLL